MQNYLNVVQQLLFEGLGAKGDIQEFTKTCLK